MAAKAKEDEKEELDVVLFSQYWFCFTSLLFGQAAENGAAKAKDDEKEGLDVVWCT